MKWFRIAFCNSTNSIFFCIDGSCNTNYWYSTEDLSIQNEDLSNLTKNIYEDKIKQLKIELHKIEAEHAAVTKAYEEEIIDSRELMQQLG